MLKAAVAAMAGAAALACAGAAGAATVYNLDVYDAAFSGSLGTVSVSGQGTSTLTFDVSLNSNVFFQMQGNGHANDVFWFDLNKSLSGGGTTSFTSSVSTSITTPDGPAPGGGDYPTGGRFIASRDTNSFGQGWSSGYDYGVTDQDSSAGPNLDYYTGHLVFTFTANDGSLLSLDDRTHDGKTVFGGADLRQCPGTDPTPSRSEGSCTTGPVGFSLAQQTSAVPEPAVWAMMLVGFGGLGAMLRYRRREAAALA